MRRQDPLASSASRLCRNDPHTLVTEVHHYGFIDALRGWAFLAVLAGHSRDHVPDLPRLLSDMLVRGYAGVQLFFVLSAFTLCLSLAARASDLAPIRAYLLRRGFRILPMFWVAIGLYLTIYGYSRESPRWGNPDGLTGFEIALAALLMHGLDVHALNGVVPGGWSVATEVQFYLLLPLMLTWASTLKRAMRLWGLSIVVSVVALPGFELLLGPFFPAAQREFVHQFAFYSLPSQLPIFVSGLVLFRLVGPDRPFLERLERRLPRTPWRRALFIVAVMIPVGFPLRPAWPPGLITHFPGHLGYGVLAALLTYAMVTYPLGLLVNPVTCFLGRISYSAYLVHFLVLSQLEPIVEPLTRGQALLHLCLLGGGGLALTVFASAVAYTFIEKPGIAIGRGLDSPSRVARGAV